MNEAKTLNGLNELDQLNRENGRDERRRHSDETVWDQGRGGERGRTEDEFPVVEPWPEPVDGKALLDELEATLTRFVVLPQWAAQTLALFTLHTYAYELRDVTTYLGVESPEKRCGKTTLLTVLVRW